MTLFGTTRAGKFVRSTALVMALATSMSGCEAIIANVCGNAENKSECRQNVAVSGILLGLIIAAAVGIGIAASDNDHDNGGGPPPAV